MVNKFGFLLEGQKRWIKIWILVMGFKIDEKYFGFLSKGHNRRNKLD